ncbi:hypothetical protein FGG78_30950 [Thioclava sp. BHET1]|nr:hypothetical protein FGG78_30950 [Thioclava sp. BHET1]
MPTGSLRLQAVIIAILAMMAANSVPVPACAEPPVLTCQEITSRTPVKTFVTPNTRAIDKDGACTLTNLRIRPSDIGIESWTVGRLRIMARQDPATIGQLPPTVLRLQADGILFSPVTEDSHMRYMIHVMQKPFSAKLSYNWDTTTGALHVQEAELSGRLLGLIRLSFDGNLPSDSLLSGFDPPDVHVKHVHIVLENKVLIENFLIPPLIGLLPSSVDPATAIPASQTLAESQVRELPDSAGTKSSKDALARFIADFPHPTGHFEEDVTLKKSLGMNDLETICDTDPVCGGHFQASYKPDKTAIIPAQ